MKNCETFEGLMSAIKSGESWLTLNSSQVNLTQENAQALADAIAKYKSLKYIFIMCKGDFGNLLDTVIESHTHILYAHYHKQKERIKDILLKRQKETRDLITKWNIRQDRSTFTNLELAKFYNNIDSIKWLDEKAYACKTNFDAFEKEINARMCKDVYIFIKNALMQNLPKELVHYTACFWMQLPCYLTPIVLKTPSIPNAHILQDKSIDRSIHLVA